MKNYDKDQQLGQEISELMLTNNLEHLSTNKIEINQVCAAMELLVNSLGISLDNPSTAKTPSRVAKFFVEELFYGLNYNNFPKMSVHANQYGYDAPVYSKRVKFHSTCEHHLVSIIGYAYIAYIPKTKVIGLSKLSRVVDFFAKRPQVQERATMQIFYSLKHILDTEDVAIAINAKHHCITMRGMHDHAVENLTYKLGGVFINGTYRNEFLATIDKN